MPYTTQQSDFWGWYLRHNSRVVWKNLSDAGLDVFAVGTANNPQSFLDLTNVLPAMSGGFKRRWGLSSFHSAVGYSSALTSRTKAFFYNNPQDAADPDNTANTNLWFLADTANFLAFKDDGSLYTGLSYPTGLTPGTEMSAVTSRSYFYYANGADFARKVNPSYTTVNTDSLMGIDYPGSGSGSKVLQDYPCALIGGQPNLIGTTYPESTGYGYLSTPTCTITDPTGSGSGASISLQLGIHGEVIGYTLVSGGTAYKQAQASITAPPAGGTQAELVLYVQVNPTAPNSGEVVGADFGGPMSFVSGRQYTVALQNSLTGHTSDVYVTNLPNTAKTGQFLDTLVQQYSVPSLSTTDTIPVYVASLNSVAGFTQNELVISIPQSGLDPQIDTVLLLASADGQDATTLYEVTTLKLSDFTLVGGYYQKYFVDTKPDTFNDKFGIQTDFSAGGVVAADFATKLTYNTSQYQYNGTADAIRTDGSVGVGVLTDYVIAHNFGISVPGGKTITGVQGLLRWSGQNNGTGEITQASLYYTGSPLGTAKTPNLQNTRALQTISLGGQTDLWGATLTPAIVNDATFGFGVRILTESSGGSDRSFLFTWTLTVYFNDGSSVTTGNEETLLASDIWAETNSDGTTNGIFLNTPPPTTLKYLTAHQGRLFGTDGRTIFFSKSLEDVTTSSGLITSKWEECWPGDYQLAVALTNEEINSLKSDGVTLHAGTEKSIFTVYGSDPTSFSVPNTAFSETGVLANDCWSVVYQEGQPSGFVWLTPDFKVMHSDFTTYQDIGTSILPILQTIDPTRIANCKVLSLTQGPYNFVILSVYLTTSTNYFQPEYYIYETRLGKWYHWTTPTMSAGPSLGHTLSVPVSFVYQFPQFTSSTETPGNRYLFIGQVNQAIIPSSSTAQFFKFDPVAINDFGTTAINWRIQTSWQDMGDSTAIKVADELDITGSDSPFDVVLYSANKQADFAAPFSVSGTTVTGPIARMGTNKFYVAGSLTSAKYYSVAIAPHTPGTSQDVLSAFALETYPMARI